MNHQKFKMCVMKKMNLKLAGIFAIITFILAGCASTVHIEKDRHADFSQFKTFAWIDHNSGKKAKVDNLEEQNVHEAVSKELQKLGWKEVKNNPDIVVSYDVLVERSTRMQSDPVYSPATSRLYFNPYTRRYGTIFYPSQFWGYQDYNVPVREGTLTVTMADANTDKTVWQGWTKDEVNSRHMTNREISSSVKSIFRKFDVAKN
jgi:Domain of unknown function (DUF4136)